MPVDQQAERRFAVLVLEDAEDLGQVGWVLLLQQVQQIGSRTDAQQPLDRVEEKVASALCRHDGCVSGHASATARRGVPKRGKREGGANISI